MPLPLCARVIPALILGLAAPASFNTAQAQSAPAACQIDDPAAWSLARQALIAAGQTDLSAIPCPVPASAGTLAEEIALPMPCGRHMIFRRIDVPSRNALDQIQASFGRVIDVEAETPQSVLSNSAWDAPLAGAFALDAEGRPLASDQLKDSVARSYYMAKYELTVPQWLLYQHGLFDKDPSLTRAEDSAECKAFASDLAQMNLRQIPAKGGLSWYDAVAFSQSYNSWAIAHDSQRLTAGEAPWLPWNQGATGYLRLPSEAEWEYAARGGAAYVSGQARGLRYPLVASPDGSPAREPQLDEICAQPARGDTPAPGPVGTKAPNLLGLYDTLCNVEEIVLDLFRPSRPDGLGGQIGGVVTRGGSSLIFREQNSLGRRSEAAALFTLQGEGRNPGMGARLMISAPVFPGRRAGSDLPVEGQFNQDILDDMMAARATLLEGGQATSLTGNVQQLRRDLSSGGLSQDELARQTAELQVQLEKLSTQLSEKDREALRFSLRSAMVTANLIDRIGRSMGLVTVELIRLAESDVSTLPRTDDNPYYHMTAEDRRNAQSRFDAGITEGELRITNALDLYLQVHLELAQRGAEEVAAALKEEQAALSAQNATSLTASLTLLSNHAKALRDQRGQISEETRARWLQELDPTRQTRLENLNRINELRQSADQR